MNTLYKQIIQDSGSNDARLYPIKQRYMEPLVIAARFTSVTPPGGARRIHIGLFDKQDRQICASTSDRDQGGGVSWWYYAYADSTLDHVNGQDENYMLWPKGMCLPPGGYVRVWDDNNRSPLDTVRIVVQGVWRS